MADQFNNFGGDALQAVSPSMVEMQSGEDDLVVDRQWAAYIRARDAGHLEWVKEARKFDEYYYGKQWDDQVKAALDAQKRPAHTINLVLSTVNAVVGQYIKSRHTFHPTFRP